MSWQFYLLGNESLLAWLGRSTTGALYMLIVGTVVGFLVTKIKLLPSWLGLLDLLDPHTKGGLGETQTKLEVIERKLDDLSQARPD